MGEKIKLCGNDIAAWTPVNDNVLMELEDQMPEYFLCRVIAIGPGILNYDGKRVPIDIEPGDVVLVRRHKADWVFVGEEKLLLTHAFNIRMKRKGPQ